MRVYQNGLDCAVYLTCLNYCWLMVETCSLRETPRYLIRAAACALEKVWSQTKAMHMWDIFVEKV